MLGSSFSAVTKRIRAMNFVNKLAVGVPYDLTPQNAQGRVEVAKTLLEVEKKGLSSML